MEALDIHPKMYIYRRIVEAKRYIDAHYHEQIDLSNISDQAHFSRYHFLRLFKEAYGKSPHRYLTEVRLSHARRLLKKGLAVKTVCFEVGFNSVPSFVTLFRKSVGCTPHTFMKQEHAAALRKMETPMSFVPNCFVESYGWDK